MNEQRGEIGIATNNDLQKAEYVDHAKNVYIQQTRATLLLGE